MSVRMVKLWDVWDFLKLSGIVVDIAWLHHGIYRIHWDDGELQQQFLLATDVGHLNLGGRMM